MSNSGQRNGKSAPKGSKKDYKKKFVKGNTPTKKKAAPKKYKQEKLVPQVLL